MRAQTLHKLPIQLFVGQRKAQLEQHFTNPLKKKKSTIQQQELQTAACPSLGVSVTTPASEQEG